MPMTRLMTIHLMTIHLMTIHLMTIHLMTIHRQAWCHQGKRHHHSACSKTPPHRPMSRRH
jgi:hypothetical protein